MNDNETMNLPVWVGVAAIVAGGLLLIVPKGSWTSRRIARALGDLGKSSPDTGFF